jgi:hypothetical protein
MISILRNMEQGYRNTTKNEQRNVMTIVNFVPSFSCRPRTYIYTMLLCINICSTKTSGTRKRMVTSGLLRRKLLAKTTETNVKKRPCLRNANRVRLSGFRQLSSSMYILLLEDIQIELLSVCKAHKLSTFAC